MGKFGSAFQSLELILRLFQAWLRLGPFQNSSFGPSAPEGLHCSLRQLVRGARATSMFWVLENLSCTILCASSVCFLSVILFLFLFLIGFLSFIPFATASTTSPTPLPLAFSSAPTSALSSLALCFLFILKSFVRIFILLFLLSCHLPHGCLGLPTVVVYCK